MDKKKNKYDVDIPKEVLDAFARYIIPEIRRFHESEEGRRFTKNGLRNIRNTQKSEKVRWGLGDLSGLFLLSTLSEPYLHSETAVKEICVRPMSVWQITLTLIEFRDEQNKS